MNWRVLNGVVLFAAATALTNCAVETNDSLAYKTSDFKNPNAKGGAGGTSTTASTVALSTECHPADAGEKLTARTVTHKGAESPTTRRIFVDDLFDRFRSLCGGCHVDGNQGNWQISRKTFNLEAARESLLAMSNDRSLVKVMPPGSVGGKLPQDRTAADPAVPLMEMLRLYIRATESGPRPYTYLEDFTSVGDASPYRMEPALADALTPLGNCIPDKGLYATDAAKMKALDVLFFNAMPKYTGTLVEQIGLPVDLKDTDLTTFDSRELAKQGVLAWAPNYPVFIDGARAIRHVRVPFGTSITFDKATQQFKIPDGTRFYKTYLKPVVELDGSLHFRKLETQLIVVFQDDATSIGFRAVMSLYGTYAWNEDETEAKLVTDPLRDGKAWRDHIITYTSNEVEEDESVNNTSVLDPGYLLIDSKAVHHFAIPGSRRCVECHQGSPSKSFVLGFQPLQIKRRRAGEGGVSEKDVPGADELTQLKRFVDYGLVKGLENENDITNLEDSELPRKPRTDQELRAQAYVMGACAHCHNDRGSATEYNAKLTGVFNLQPSTGQYGGIFEFPLDRYSESIFRGGSEHVQVPYITPSLFDRVSSLTDGGLWRPKCSPKDYNVSCLSVCDTPNPGNSSVCDHYGSACGSITYARNCRLAPWRSLIYRGVDTPFAYSDDLALFPKMPMHTPGFDCRAPQIMAEWMTSIPSIRVVPGDNEDIMGVTHDDGPTWPDFVTVDLSPQPYLEVPRNDKRFSEAQSLAEARLRAYRQEVKLPASGSASPLDFWPCDADIFDPNVLKDSMKNPVPVDKLVGGLPLDNVPNSGHWVIQDATLVPGDWSPRRADWQAVLQNKQYGDGTTDHEKLVVGVLQNVTLSDNLQYFAYKKRPMTLWKKKANCNFSGEPTVAFYASNPPLWMASMVHSDTADTTQPVYRLSPGEYVNNLVCAHCHGPKGDATGREANTLLEMTGGYARVTNFLQGISIASNRAKVFGGLSSGSAEDWASRYFAWMGLGGTRTAIPGSIISLVATNDSMGQKRGNYVPPKDANMLSAPEDFCRWTLPLNKTFGDGGIAVYHTSLPMDNVAKLNPDGSPLIRVNGDQELWLQLCGIDNPHPVRAMHLELQDHGWVWIYKPDGSLYSASDFPKTAPVMDHKGGVSIGIQNANLSPWCLRQPATDEGKAAAEQWRQAHPIDKNTLVPYCPTCRDCREGEPCATVGDICKSGTLPYIVPFTSDLDTHSKLPGDKPLSLAELDKWAIRGAVNAGLVAFEHFKTVAESASVTTTPGYDECEKLTP